MRNEEPSSGAMRAATKMDREYFSLQIIPARLREQRIQEMAILFDTETGHRELLVELKHADAELEHWLKNSPLDGVTHFHMTGLLESIRRTIRVHSDA